MSKEAEFCKIVYDSFGVVAKWVCEGLKTDTAWLGDSMALGFIVDGKLVGGLIYSQARQGVDVWWTIYTIDKRWCTKRILRKIFAVAFEVMSCRRINLLVDTDNEDCLSLVSKLGFKQEGLLREFREDGKDCYFLGMLKNECKWR